MKGYFISTTDGFNPTAFVSEIEYFIDDPNAYYPTSGIWEKTKIENHENHLILKPTPGYHLRINKIKNPYFEKLCEMKTCTCDGWMETKTYSPYRVCRRKGDRMYLLLAMDLDQKPVNVKRSTLENLLSNCKFIKRDHNV